MQPRLLAKIACMMTSCADPRGDGAALGTPHSPCRRLCDNNHIALLLAACELGWHVVFWRGEGRRSCASPNGRAGSCQWRGAVRLA